MKTTVRHEITVRTVPASKGSEMVITTVVMDTATVEQTEVVSAANRSNLLAHMGWKVTLADGRVGHLTEDGVLTTVTGRSGRRVRVTDDLTVTFFNELLGSRLVRLARFQG